jgi:phage shock protein A
VNDQKAEVETLKNSLQSLEGKLVEARAKSEMLIARHRRARASKRAVEAKTGAGAGATFERMKDRVLEAEAVSRAWTEVTGDDVDGRFAALEKEKEIDRLLSEIKSRKLLEA